MTTEAAAGTGSKLLREISKELNITQTALFDIIVEFWVASPEGYMDLQEACAYLREIQEKHPTLMNQLST